MRAIIVANGPVPDYPAGFERQEEDTIIAANGGTVTALRWGWLPHAVVGDLDSLPLELRERLQALGCQFVTFPKRKDWTDLELALQHAIELGASEIVVLGARGGRLDQELANLLLLSRPEWAGVTVRLLDSQDEACVVRQQCTVSGQVGDIVSLIALTPQVAGIVSQGLEWPLRDETLWFGSTRGISNELVQPRASVHVKEGVLLVVHGKRRARGGEPQGEADKRSIAWDKGEERG